MTQHIRRFLPLCAFALLWGVSLALPAVRVRGGPVFDGADLLLRGWQGAARGILAWYANPLFAAALALAALRRDVAAAVLSLLALALALTSFALEPLLELGMASVPDIGFLPGLYVWLSALAAAAVWSSLRAPWGGRGPETAREERGIDRPQGSP
ncbi:MAG TPA: hypothetical protein VFV10_14100 [Gammaproteobacteria bacterium]|nr:hypothetical protein [Gammaproteobacteria bacterium]